MCLLANDTCTCTGIISLSSIVYWVYFLAQFNTTIWPHCCKYISLMSFKKCDIKLLKGSTVSKYCTIIDSDGGIWYFGRVTGAALYLQADRTVKPAGRQYSDICGII
jgi:hypothetical protein